MKLFYLLPLIIITACGLPINKKIKERSIAPEAQPFVNSFEAKRGYQADNLKVSFTENLGENVLAYCATGTKIVLKFPQNHEYEIKHVVISRTQWNKFYTHHKKLIDLYESATFRTESERTNEALKRAAQEREVLIYHELGHCLLKRNHTDSLLASGMPSSVMNTYHIGEQTYGQMYGHYQAELFRQPLLATAQFNMDEYKVAASTLQASSYEASESIKDEHNHPVEGELHGGCVHDLGVVVVDERDKE